MNDVKFSDMTVGDAVAFKKAPVRGAPRVGVVSELTRTHVTYKQGEEQTTLRRASLVCDSRRRVDGGKWSWTFE